MTRRIGFFVLTPAIPAVTPALARSDTMLPAWFVFPLAALAIVVLAGHLMIIARDATMPPSRRRIRTVTGVLMMAITPLAAYAFALTPVNEARTFVLIFAAVVGLLGIVIMLAGIDIANNVRLHRLEQKQVRRKLAELRRQGGSGGLTQSGASDAAP
jgi:hypothetical protein